MTDIVGNETVRSLWEGLAATRGDHTFLIYQDRMGNTCEYTYRRFNAEIDRTANFFLDLGIGKGECVAVQMHTSPEFMMCLFGLAKIGAVMVPMNEQYLKEECIYVLETCDIACVIAAEEFSELYLGIAADEHPLEKGLFLASPLPDPVENGVRAQGGQDGGTGAGRPIDPACDFKRLKDAQPSVLKELRMLSSDDLAEVLFTSGTTSLPKGVELTHCNLLYSGIYGAWEVALTEDDRMLSTMPACHSNFQLAALTPVLAAGATLIAIEKYSARRFWKQIRDYRATVTQCIAMMLRTLMLQPVDPDEQDHCLREVLYFLPVSDDEKLAFERRFDVRIMNTYGSTESLVWVLTDPPFGERKWPSVGRVGLSYEVKIVDDDGFEVDPMVIGEIMVKGIPGRTIMKGYYGAPEITAATISEDGWMHTGDKGYQDRSGWFYFFDRKVNMIKRSGENISTTEIETILNEHPKIAEAAVIGVPDPIRDQAVKAFVLPASGESITEQEVIDYCKTRMAAFKVPSFVEIRDDFPRTCSMKIEKRLLS